MMNKFTLRSVMTMSFLMLLSTLTFAQTARLQGRVVDSEGAGVPGATVQILGQQISTSSGANGEYSLGNISAGSHRVVVNMMGYETAEQNVTLTAGDNTLNFTLETTSSSLDEVVVIGYGTARKKQITGSVSSVAPEEFNKGVVISPDQLLAGKVAGLTVNRSGGDPTSGSNIQLRGPSSLTASSSPLYVIDGIVGASIELVAPDDIVSMDVMKDASSTAIYGSRAANGVIFVTTKRGKAGAPVLTYSGWAASESVANRVNVLNATEHSQFLQDHGLSVAASETGHDTDWQKEITRSGFSHNHNLSLTGGSEGTRYNASVNYFNNQGIVKRNGVERIIARAGVDQNAFDDRLKLAFNLSNSINNSDHVDYNIFNGAARYLPTSPIMSDDPSYEQYGGYFQVPGRTNYFNPVAILNQRDESRSNNVLMGNFKADLTIVDGLIWSNVLSYQRTHYDKKYYMHRTDFDSKALGRGYADRTNLKHIDKILESYLNYSLTKDKHTFDAMAGYSYQRTKNDDGIWASSVGFLSDDLGSNNLNLGMLPEGYNPFTDSPILKESVLISFFGRVGYNFDDKYLVSASLRQDGSSKFGINNRWATFPSVSAAWRLSSESFMEDQNLFSDLKLRAGYGVSGNQNIDPYRSIVVFGPQSGQFLYNGTWMSAYGVNQNENPDLKWETTSMFNVGLDFELLRGRFSGTVEYYDKRTRDLLYEYDVPSPPYQHNRLLANGASMNNKGVEVVLNANVYSNADFSYSTTVNFARNVNEVGSLESNIENIGVSQRYEGSIGLEGWTGQTASIVLPGQPIGTFYVAKYIGYDENAGRTIYQKPSGELVTQDQISAPDDYQIMGHALPKFTYGWNNNFRYKSWDLNFFLRGMYGNQIFNATRADLSRLQQANVTNISKDAVAEGIFETPLIASSRFIEDASFLRLDNATLGYRFNTSNNRYFKQARLYVTGQNLFVLTNYSGVDPEVNLGGLDPGIDNRNYYPRTRSFVVGVNLTF
ncbi:SusC/RagA family TonB-linked outer membrane protein [Sphingobacterium chuzhouense]|uniref:SusC/RagA family TonB-linked outer membrane protein n=1 Tax=Sphingobacterium chuzhouense TaxID=1742264 RepID=A0ABR7XQB5_9SPHI|nr:SusC/RagA family TonB-linked outer membrane protein [Sphingobacterium chuzhouense]MBD1421360.1 SusC/RagA family TonB-linked outer membrane protein [Sphingobacterium chuzhouense]